MVQNLTPDGYQPRVVDAEMEAALAASPVVLVEGPRACGRGNRTSHRGPNCGKHRNATSSTRPRQPKDPL